MRRNIRGEFVERYLVPVKDLDTPSSHVLARFKRDLYEKVRHQGVVPDGDTLAWRVWVDAGGDTYMSLSVRAVQFTPAKGAAE